MTGLLWFGAATRLPRPGSVNLDSSTAPDRSVDDQRGGRLATLGF